MIGIFTLIKFFMSILFETQKIGSIFISIGNYSHKNISDLNTVECGLSLVPIINPLIFKNICFQREFNDKTVVFFDNYVHQISSDILQRIYRGEDAEYNEAPWTVYLEPQKVNNKTTCTGVLITFEWVLTAAHCHHNWKDEENSGVSITAGGNVKSGTQRRYAKSKYWFSHPVYTDPTVPNQNLSNKKLGLRKAFHDIALIKMSDKFRREVSLNNRYEINTICLPQTKHFLDDLNDGPENAIYFGYGKYNSEEYPKRLQKARITIKPFDSCYYSYCTDFFGNGDNRDNRARLCPGDSGGPLVQYSMRRAILIGIARSIKRKDNQTKCDSTIIGADFSAVPIHMNWILETILNNSKLE